MVAALILLFGASLIHSVATNKQLEWHVVGQFLFDPRILNGVVLTIELTVSAMAMGVLLGVLLAVMRLSPNPLVRSIRAFRSASLSSESSSRTAARTR